MEAEKVYLTEEKETLLATLYARALDSREERPLLGDEIADHLVRRIDYDFRKVKTSTGDRFALMIRAKQLDVWTKDFLANNPDATMLHLGCGLDSRVLRTDPPPGVRWFDVDYPEVIELRRRLYPEREGYHMIGSSVTDPRWLPDVPADRPVMVVAEGLLMYLSEKDVRDLLDRLTQRFPGGQMAFDVINRFAGWAGRYKGAIKATGASFGWAIDDPAEIETWNPRLELVEQATIIGSPYVARMPWAYRGLCRTMNRFPALRNLMRLLRYRF